LGGAASVVPGLGPGSPPLASLGPMSELACRGGTVERARGLTSPSPPTFPDMNPSRRPFRSLTPVALRDPMKAARRPVITPVAVTMTNLARVLPVYPYTLRCCGTFACRWSVMSF